MISLIEGLGLRELVIAKSYLLLIKKYIRWDIGNLLTSSVVTRLLAANAVGII
jgi:hypothetical protein